MDFTKNEIENAKQNTIELLRKREESLKYFLTRNFEDKFVEVQIMHELATVYIDEIKLCRIMIELLDR